MTKWYCSFFALSLSLPSLVSHFFNVKILIFEEKMNTQNMCYIKNYLCSVAHKTCMSGFINALLYKILVRLLMRMLCVIFIKKQTLAFSSPTEFSLVTCLSLVTTISIWHFSPKCFSTCTTFQIHFAQYCLLKFRVYFILFECLTKRNAWLDFPLKMQNAHSQASIGCVLLFLFLSFILVYLIFLYHSCHIVIFTLTVSSNRVNVYQYVNAYWHVNKNAIDIWIVIHA